MTQVPSCQWLVGELVWLQQMMQWLQCHWQHPAPAFTLQCANGILELLIRYMGSTSPFILGMYCVLAVWLWCWCCAISCYCCCGCCCGCCCKALEPALTCEMASSRRFSNSCIKCYFFISLLTTSRFWLLHDMNCAQQQQLRQMPASGSCYRRTYCEHWHWIRAPVCSRP